jgi:sortase A
MNPDKSSPGGDVPAPVAGDDSTPPNNQTQSAAANVLRTQINAMFEHTHHQAARPAAHTAAPATPPVEESTYHRTHNPHPHPQADQWKEYHSAWQNYYQKYYENYYTHELSKATPTEPTGPSHYFANQPTDAEQTAEELSSDQALLELRQKLLGRVQESAEKVRKSRHFIPVVAAVAVVLIFLFLQYNRVIFSNVQAYVSPGSIDPQNIVVDPSTDVVVSSEPRLIIPKINVDVPVLYDVGIDNDSQMAAMEKGVAHFPIPGANSHPGEVGNTALAGHSSNDLFDAGDYKFIFAQLEKLVPGDSIYANYQGKRYTYVVTKTETVKPQEVNKLVYPTTKPVMTLITCTPLGTALNRFLVTAEQVSPDPSSAASAPVNNSDETAVIPGNSPTFFERLFGGGN